MCDLYDEDPFEKGEQRNCFHPRDRIFYEEQIPKGDKLFITTRYVCHQTGNIYFTERIVEKEVSKQPQLKVVNN